MSGMERQRQTEETLNCEAGFWVDSWMRVDSERITEYIHTFDMGADEIIAALHRYGVQSVCDAGCGCGIYVLKLAANGFTVSGFDVSAKAVEIARTLLGRTVHSAELKTASILATGYADGQFDCVISRDVLDHISKKDAVKAVKELCRITRPGGIVVFTLDALDEEYENETHIVNVDGDYVYTDGKWNGMVFHPYGRDEVREIIPSDIMYEVSDACGELTVLLRRS